jgi:RNA polymerase-binding transcription factor DksA
VKRRAGAKRAGAAGKSAAKKKVMKKKAANKIVRKKVTKKPAGKSVGKLAKKPLQKAVKKAPARKTAAPKQSDAKQSPKAMAVPAKAAYAGKPVAKPAQAARRVKTDRKADRAATVKQAKPEPVVRPLGVLPPESRARLRRTAADGPRVAFPDRPHPQSQNIKASQGAERLSDQDLKIFEERLLAERQKILRDMGHLETTVLKVNQRDSAGDLSGYSFHMADAGTDAMEREKAFLFASAEGRLLFEINDALRRLYNGEYGSCETCGQPIARARLEAIPHARQCVTCKSKEERAGRGAQ